MDAFKATVEKKRVEQLESVKIDEDAVVHKKKGRRPRFEHITRDENKYLEQTFKTSLSSLAASMVLALHQKVMDMMSIQEDLLNKVSIEDIFQKVKGKILADYSKSNICRLSAAASGKRFIVNIMKIVLMDCEKLHDKALMKNIQDYVSIVNKSSNVSGLYVISRKRKSPVKNKNQHLKNQSPAKKKHLMKNKKKEVDEEEEDEEDDDYEEEEDDDDYSEEGSVDGEDSNDELISNKKIRHSQDTQGRGSEEVLAVQDNENQGVRRQAAALPNKDLNLDEFHQEVINLKVHSDDGSILAVHYQYNSGHCKGTFHGTIQSCFVVVESFIRGELSKEKCVNQVANICFGALPLKYWMVENDDLYHHTPINGFCGYVLQLQFYLHWLNSRETTSSATIEKEYDDFPYSEKFKTFMTAEYNRLKEIHNEDIGGLAETISGLEHLLGFIERPTNKSKCRAYPQDHWTLGYNMCNFLFPQSYPRIMFSWDNTIYSDPYYDGYVSLVEARESGYGIISYDELYTMSHLLTVFESNSHPYVGCLNRNHFYPLIVNFKEVYEEIRDLYGMLMKQLVDCILRFKNLEQRNRFYAFTRSITIENKNLRRSKHHGEVIEIPSTPKQKQIECNKEDASKSLVSKEERIQQLEEEVSFLSGKLEITKAALAYLHSEDNNSVASSKSDSFSTPISNKSSLTTKEDTDRCSPPVANIDQTDYQYVTPTKTKKKRLRRAL